MATAVMPQQPPPATVTPAATSHRGRWITIALVMIAVIAVVGVIVANRHNSGTAATCTHGSPQLPGQLEHDMQHLENLTCR